MKLGVGAAVRQDLTALLDAVDSFCHRPRSTVDGPQLVLLRQAIGKLELEFATSRDDLRFDW